MKKRQRSAKTRGCAAIGRPASATKTRWTWCGYAAPSKPERQRALHQIKQAKKMIAVLFARKDSLYHSLAICDVWDEARDARKWPGGAPVIAHPPCRAWGRLRTFAKPAPHEKDLARWAVAQVRQHGGVLEHPAGSTLWADQNLPAPGARDAFGGWTLSAPQKWWGHRAEKATWFYIVGCEPGDIPALPYVMGEAPYVVQTSTKNKPRPHITRAERESTPAALTRWLVALAQSCTAPAPALFLAHAHAGELCNDCARQVQPIAAPGNAD